MLRQILHGTGVALVTPFTPEFEIDYNALSRVIDFVINGEAEYVVVLGTTGETPTLSKEEKISLVNFTYDYVDNRVPVVVGIGGNDTRALLRDLQKFPLDRAAAVLSASPYYSRPSQQGLYIHYKVLAEASPRPMLIYNVPSRTGRNVNANTILKLAHSVKNIAGVKEAGGDFGQCMKILRDRPENFLVVSGDDALALPQLACGMDGVISVAANSFPQQFSDMVRDCIKGDFGHAKMLNDLLLEGYELLFAENNPAGVKAALSKMGLIENFLRLPVVPLSDELQDKLELYLEKNFMLKSR